MNSNSLYGGKTVGMPINSVESVNIDTPEDWENALSKLPNLILQL